MTFICSKTDDISVMEAQDSLGLEEEIGNLDTEAEVHRKEIRKLEKQIEESKDTKSDLREASDLALSDLEVWEGLKDDCEDGKVVFDPSNKKRKHRSSSSSQTRKRRRSDETDSEASEAENSDSDGETTDDEGETEPPLKALTLEEIKTKITELRNVKKESRRQISDIDEQLKPTRDSIKDLKDLVKVIDTKQRAMCIAGRNAYSKGASPDYPIN